jgi:SAM-dependent methyltransferase
MSIPRLFDHALVAERLARVLQRGNGADFLMARAVEDLAERLDAVTRRFEVGVALGDPTGGLARALQRSGKVGRVVDARPPGSAGGDLQTEAEALPFAPASANLVVSALALHLVDDLPGVLAQIRQALAPDGLFLAVLPGGETLTELRQALLAAEAEVTGGASPRVMPFVDLRDLGALLQRAGFALPVVDADRVTVRYATMFGLIRDLRAMAATNPLSERGRRPPPRALFFRAAALYAERFSDPDGRIRATFELVSCSGWAPHESQQKPLRPGSAAARLADALGTRELPAGERAGAPPSGPRR